MVCYAAQNNLLKPVEGNSGSYSCPSCVTTSTGFFIGDIMKRIPLTQGQFALVSNEDYEWLSQWKWCASKLHYGGFAATRAVIGTSKRMFMHRVITNCPKGFQVDHKNHNTLDNQRRNLRICTHSQNQHNQKIRKGASSRYKGVAAAQGKWAAQIKFDNKSHYLGLFEVEIEAAAAYDSKAKELYGEFANVNLS